MTSQRLGGCSDKMPDTAAQIYKQFPRGSISFVHSEPQETVLI